MSLSVNMMLKQQQKLVMTPLMQQSIRLLQLNALQLEQLARQEMLENPFLEVSDDQETATEEEFSEETVEATPSETKQDTLQESGVADSSTQTSQDAADDEAPSTVETFKQTDVNWDEVYEGSENRVYYPRGEIEEDDFTQYTAARVSLYDDLLRQLHIAGLADTQQRIGEYLIGSIDDDGYLKTSVEEAARDLKCTTEEIETVLGIIHTFEPDGIGARDLPECLILQLTARGIEDETTFEVIRNHFLNLQKKEFEKIAKMLDVDTHKIKKIYTRIASLEPKPGRVKSKEESHYITPDVYVKEVDGKYLYYLNEGNSSHLRVNAFYRELLRGNNSLKPEERNYAVDKFKSAVWLIRNIEKRRSTILAVTEAIMDYQKKFLEKGIAHLKPLTLKQIADIVGMHESTVQRVTSGKYADTPRGIFELKFFFSSGLRRNADESTSSIAIKDQIRIFIKGENHSRPLSDQQIVDMLKAKGITIARRTIAKYRDQMKILPAKMRKSVS